MIVWLWLLTSSAGTVVAAISLVDAIRDYRSLGEIRNGRRILALREIRVEGVRLVIQSSWASLGLLALLAGGTAAGGTEELSLGRVVLILSNGLLLINSSLDLRDRLRLRRLIG